ncbi:hypothetical protein SO802_021347 [Lithocarpus litseifolius]|uniref:Uncharacterized protein n=1 Tax=Lithocarpus litseifolius TaxID=425828 RepID=A0AAW2CEN5_9ROSI
MDGNQGASLPWNLGRLGGFFISIYLWGPRDFSTLILNGRQFKMFMKNANAKGFDKDHRQSSSSQSKSQDQGKKDAKDGDDRILNAFTAIVNPIEGIVEDVDKEEELVESKFEKMDEEDDIHIAYAKLYMVSKKHKKLYRLATEELSDVELEREELSTKFDEANQTIGPLSTTIFVPPANNVETENNEVNNELAS